MAQFLTPETFEFFAKYLLAGYIVIIVRSRFIVGVRPKPAEVVIEAVIFSLINQLTFSGLIAVLPDQFLAILDKQLILFAEILFLPALFGLLLGWNLSRGWNNAFLGRLSMPVAHPVQRAHDYAFGNNRAPSLVIVTYEDGTVIRGYFGEASLAASDATRSDIYLERLYVEDESGQWKEIQPGRSGLITLNGVRSIEFLDETGD